MRNARTIFLFIFSIFFVIAVLGGLFWANLNLINHVPGGADFIVPWKAMQNFMMSGVTPYGEFTVLNIQTLIYNHPLAKGDFPYNVNVPLYMLMLYIPFAWIKNLAVARAIWMIFLELGLIAVVYISLRLARWKQNWIFLLTVLFFSAFWLPSITMLLTSTAIILQALVLFGALRSIELGSDEFGGALAALGLLNIEATGLVFVALIVWIFSTQRWRVLGGIVMMLGVLLGLSFLLFPGWVVPFLTAAISNWQSGLIPSTFSILEGWLPGIGHRLAEILAAAALSLILIEWWAVRGRNIRWLFWTACFTAAVTPLLGVPYFPSWLVFTLPGILLIVSSMIQRWGLLGFGSSILVLVVVFLGLWAAFENQITSAFIFFYPLGLTLLLYWVRWGAVHQPRMWADEVMLRR